MLDDETTCTAIEYDLIALGLRLRWLGTEQLTWRDLKVVVTHSDSRSAQFRAAYPDLEVWGVPEQLLARAVEALERLWWAKTKDAKHGRNKPEPIYRPGVARAQEDSNIGSPETALTIEEMDAWLGWSPVPNGTPAEKG
jgi:hypothetical protein